MASRFVVCKDKEEAQRMFEAGLLYVNYATLAQPAKYEPAINTFSVRWGLREYGHSPWPAKDFAYLVEEDDKPNEDDACG